MKTFEGDEKLRFAKVMAAMSTVYDKELSEEQIRLYELALCDVPIKVIERKALEHMQTSRFFPRPCDLRAKQSKYRLEWNRKARLSAKKSREDYLRLAETRQAMKQLPSPKSLGELVR